MRHKDKKRQKEIHAFWSKYGLDPIKMERFEKGKQAMTVEDVVEICTKTGMSADYILFGKESSPPRIRILCSSGNA